MILPGTIGGSARSATNQFFDVFFSLWAEAGLNEVSIRIHNKRCGQGYGGFPAKLRPWIFRQHTVFNTHFSSQVDQFLATNIIKIHAQDYHGTGAVDTVQLWNFLQALCPTFLMP